MHSNSNKGGLIWSDFLKRRGIFMNKGKVKFFNETKGFGFITPENGDKDIFVHVSNIEQGELNDGDQVEYEVGEGRKGPCAINVKKL